VDHSKEANNIYILQIPFLINRDEETRGDGEEYDSLQPDTGSEDTQKTTYNLSWDASKV